MWEDTNDWFFGMYRVGSGPSEANEVRFNATTMHEITLPKAN
jgi:hypothetical protein